MASVNWQKHSGGTSVKAQFRHCDLDERLKTNHSNMQIDSSLTNRNLSFGCFTRSYKSACAEYDNRVKDIDDHANLTRKPRKDRVTCVSWSIPCPANMPDDMASKWFSDVYSLLTREYSDVLGASVHFDEVHEYVDAFTGENTKSRAHMHAFVLPVVEKDGVRRLNGKEFVKKADYTKLNKGIQKLTDDKYPGYTFMTGVKHQGEYQTVEDLKPQSKRLQAEKERVQKEIEADKSNAVQDIHAEGVKLDARERKLVERERAVSERESQVKEKEDYWADYEIQVKDIESSTDVSKDSFLNWSYPTKDGGSFPIMRMWERFVKETTKAANTKKQNLPKHSSSPKPVDYAQKAIEEAGRQIGSMIEKSARESIERKKLVIPWEQEEQSGDEMSY